MTAVLEAARQYLSMGLHPIPCAPRSKRPLVEWKRYQDEPPLVDEIEMWWEEHPDANVALVLGRGAFALDFDGGDAAERLLFDRGILLPKDAPRSRTANGVHVFLASPTPVPDRIGLLSTNGGKPQVDVKGIGYVVAPPSIHPTGARYEWEIPLTLPLPEAPAILLDLIFSGRDERPESVAEGGWVPEALRGVPEGQRNTTCARLAGWFLRRGLDPVAVEAVLAESYARNCRPPFPASEVRKVVRSIASREASEAEHAARAGGSPWGAARPAPDFLSCSDEIQEWLEKPLLAPGSITEVFSPRGIGKTHVAHALGVKLARTGKRVLLLDRDNSRREVRRRLRAWGAGEAPTLKVMTRDEAPPLTDTEAWREFPFRDYDLTIIDSLDATTEGVGEKDSAKPSKAIAPMLDIARRSEGPAFLVLGNTVKTAEHGRGSGVIEDRADICFEVRDATDLKPTGTKPWWIELPPAGAGAWAERAARRRRRTSYRLAFIPSKFRVGEEPDPFILDINLSSELWTLQDVTAEVVEAGEAAKQEAERQHQAKLNAAALDLAQEIQRRAQANDPGLKDKEAIPFLMARGLKQAEARQLLADQEGRSWGIKILTDRRGRPKALFPVDGDGDQSKPPATENTLSETPVFMGEGEALFSVDRMDTRQRKMPLSEPASNAGIRDPCLFPSKGSDTDSEPLEEVEL